jgi:RNA-directed DNA polymerase
MTASPLSGILQNLQHATNDWGGRVRRETGNKPETFDFLGFKHYCATRRDGTGFVLGRKPMAKRMRTKLREIKEQLKATRHDGIDGQGKWLA